MRKKKLGQQMWIVSIHDRASAGFLALDVKDILACLGPSVDGLLWTIQDLECTGPRAQELANLVRRQRLLCSTEVLCYLFETDVEQTIEGLLIGMRPKKLDDIDAAGDLNQFPDSCAQIVVRAVDSSCFEVVSKERRQIELLKQAFKDVHEEDVQHYFPLPAGR